MCVKMDGSYGPSQNVFWSLFHWCDYDGTLYEKFVYNAYGWDGDSDSSNSNNKDDCLDCCIDHFKIFYKMRHWLL